MSLAPDRPSWANDLNDNPWLQGSSTARSTSGGADTSGRTCARASSAASAGSTSRSSTSVNAPATSGVGLSGGACSRTNSSAPSWFSNANKSDSTKGSGSGTSTSRSSMNAPATSGAGLSGGVCSRANSSAPSWFSKEDKTGSAKGSGSGGGSLLRWPSKQQQPQQQPRFHEGPELDDLSVEELEGLTAAHESGISDAQRRMLKQALETRQLGGQTLEQLHTQKHQLKRITGDQHKLGGNLQRSNQLMKGMGMRGWLGWLPDRLTGLRPPSQGELTSEQRAEAGGGSGEPRGAGSGAPNPASSAAASPWGKSKPSDEEPAPSRGVDQEGMRELSGVLNDLRLQALSMNDELKEQSGIIDTVNDRADDHSSSIKKNNRRARDIAGSSAASRIADTFTAPRATKSWGIGGGSAKTAAKIGYNSAVARANLGRGM